MTTDRAEIRAWMRLIEDALAPNDAVKQMIALLTGDTRRDPEGAIQQIAALKDQIPEEYRNSPRVLWRTAGLSLDAAKQFLAGQQVQTMYRIYTSWARDREQAAQFLGPDPLHPTVLYRGFIDPANVIFNTEFDGSTAIANMLTEVIIEMNTRLATASFANVAAMAVNPEQYEALVGQPPEVEPSPYYGLVLRFGSNKIARVDPGPAFEIFKPSFR